MTALANMPHLTLVVLAATFFLLASGQTVHALLVALRRGFTPTAAIAAYEGAVALHLVLACCGAVAAAQNYGAFYVRLRPFDLPLEPFLWIDLAAAALGLALVVAKRKPAMLPEIALLALCTPPVIEALGGWCVYLFIVDAAFFLFRTVAALVLDVRYFATSVSSLSVVDALDRLPEGIIWADGKRRILYMNDAMRARLTDLGFATDLSETASLWTDLEARARRDGGAVLSEGIRLPMPSGQTCLFKRDVVRLRNTECRRMVAMDVTEEESLNAQIEQANRLLEAENAELRESMARVAEVARDEALVRMKARVHDTIGQRLSILHRFLEAEDPTPEALAEVTKLAGSILDDLAEPESPDRAAQLASIVRAFSLVGITVRVTGELPARADVAEAFVNIIREAATNAAKHGQAKHVDVAIDQAGGACALRIVNDGMPAPANVREGSGIPGMRRAAAGVGATFAVTSRSPFSLEVIAPAPGVASSAAGPTARVCAVPAAASAAVVVSAADYAGAGVPASADRPAASVPPSPRKGAVMISLLIVEDQVMLRESLACTINAQDDMQVVAALGDAAEALGALERSGADCALLDVCTENDSSGIVAARKIKQAHPEARVIIMTGMPEITFVQQARDAGVDSFVYKNVGTAELLGVIRSTMNGYSTFPAAQQSIFSDAAELTERELDILRLVCETKTRKEIAAELYVSEGTVKRHISEILAKTGYDNILRLAVHAVSTGLIVPGMTKGADDE